MELGRHANELGACIMTYPHKLACLHTLFFCVWAYIWAQLGKVREIEVSMESRRHANHFGACIMT